jgi:flagellar FliL protein
MAEPKKPEPVILPVFALKPFVVNLADKKSRRYLKVTMKLELSNEELLEEVDKRRAQLRDVVLTLLSSKTAAEISTLEGKFLLRQDIIKRVNVNLVTGKVTKVYWEEFVVQ